MSLSSTPLTNWADCAARNAWPTRPLRRSPPAAACRSGESRKRPVAARCGPWPPCGAGSSWPPSLQSAGPVPGGFAAPRRPVAGRTRPSPPPSVAARSRPRPTAGLTRADSCRPDTTLERRLLSSAPSGHRRPLFRGVSSASRSFPKRPPAQSTPLLPSRAAIASLPVVAPCPPDRAIACSRVLQVSTPKSTGSP